MSTSAVSPANTAVTPGLTPVRDDNQALYDSLKASLQSQGPVGGSRSYRTRSNGDVVILNTNPTIIPKTGIKRVDNVSREMTTTVDTTRGVVSEFFNAVFKGGLYGSITGAIIGFAIKATTFIPAKKFGKLGLTMALFAMAGGMIGSTLQGVKSFINGTRKMTSSTFSLLNGVLGK